MLELLLPLAVMAQSGDARLFANEYCWSRFRGDNHEEAMEIAGETWQGIEYTDEADKYIEIYCPFIGFQDEKTD